jgi:hypothetical protein
MGDSPEIRQRSISAPAEMIAFSYSFKENKDAALKLLALRLPIWTVWQRQC